MNARIKHHQIASGMDGSYDTACGWFGIRAHRIADSAITVTCGTCRRLMNLPPIPKRERRQGWTGKKCPHCNGTGEQSDSARSGCAHCSGTGDEYGDLPEPIDTALWARETEATGL